MRSACKNIYLFSYSVKIIFMMNPLDSEHEYELRHLVTVWSRLSNFSKPQFLHLLKKKERKKEKSSLSCVIVPILYGLVTSKWTVVCESLRMVFGIQ